MPSEIGYMAQRMEAEQQMRTNVEMTPLKKEIEAVFNPRNIDDDCDRISHLLHPYRVQIEDLLDKGECHEAFSLFYELLESLSYHFVKDEHFCHFDDMYCPDYTCGDMLGTIIKKIKDGVVAEANMKYLSEAMDKVSRMEAYADYGSPSVISGWNRFLRESKLFSDYKLG